MVSLMGNRTLVTTSGDSELCQRNLANPFLPSHQQSNNNASTSATMQLSHQPDSFTSNLWSDKIRYGTPTDYTGELVGFQSPPTTTFSFDTLQPFDTFDLNDDFILFDNATDFNYDSSMGMAELFQTDFNSTQESQPMYTFGSPGSEVSASGVNEFTLQAPDRNNQDSIQPQTLSSAPHRPATRYNCAHATCQASYKRRYELYRHQRVHNGVRNHVCHFVGCHKAAPNGFARKDHLRQHLRQVHGV
ncbi:uncharacterized protein LY89DRAFT_110461 [Mollisia scopiformis]|uniref:C2H2-type domain-containing protein n=1 Tax=Mollisia scopiformis TaxID=149040 RepID=A0A194X587_MOLSC|nr:uncharacterized protein LY89DRAFT_110461 [Mollisia scopiformis]KUJ15348.1 hypothetical protein LY89DRAFT_110461 [Mollisia scopiformis]